MVRINDCWPASKIVLAFSLMIGICSGPASAQTFEEDLKVLGEITEFKVDFNDPYRKGTWNQRKIDHIECFLFVTRLGLDNPATERYTQFGIVVPLRGLQEITLGSNNGHLRATTARGINAYQVTRYGRPGYLELLDIYNVIENDSALSELGVIKKRTVEFEFLNELADLNEAAGILSRLIKHCSGS